MRPGKAFIFLAIYNLVQNSLLRKRGYVAGNVLATGLGLAWARRSGLDWRELGISKETAAPGLALGVGVASAVSILILLRRDDVRVQVALDDERLRDVSNVEAWYRFLVRFPLGTALFEEVWFRGMLPASLRQHGATRPDLAANLAFAAWHLIPTAHAIDANRGGRSLSPRRRAELILGGAAVAGLGGLGLATLRRAASSLIAPWVAHATFNGLVLWVGLKHQRAARSL